MPSASASSIWYSKNKEDLRKEGGSKEGSEEGNKAKGYQPPPPVAVLLVLVSSVVGEALRTLRLLV